MRSRKQTAAPTGAEDATLYIAFEIGEKSWVGGELLRQTAEVNVQAERDRRKQVRTVNEERDPVRGIEIDRSCSNLSGHVAGCGN